MLDALRDFDIFPKVFLVGTPQDITVHPYQARGNTLVPGERYPLWILEAEKAEECRFPGTDATKELTVTADNKGDLHIPITCPREGMYFIVIRTPNGEGRITTLRVYALSEDMKGRYPFRGDLHMHTCRSDGHDMPAVVASNYRFHGYDFTVISDHCRYYPSLEAREIFGIDKQDESPLTDLLIVPGEEIHLPLNSIHMVNFGGKFSINALVTPSPNAEKGDDVTYRSFDGKCPDTITSEEYAVMIEKMSKDVPLDIESERRSFASACWIHEMVEKADGLCIFAHPYWLCASMQLSESYVRYLYEKHPFDAFEVLGGEVYYAHNGFQTAFYYEMKAKGYDYPVVGSTDSHNSSEDSRASRICSTIVFTPENKVDSLISAIKAKYSVAVDTISAEYRLVGDFRLIKYASFLMENWYPLHDAACKGEGYYLGRYADGDSDAEQVLRAMKGRIPRMMKKYFNI